MERHQQPKAFKRNGAYHVRYYITQDGVRIQKSHRLCPITDGANKAKQLCAEFLAEQVNIGKENAGPMGVVAFWDDVYLPFLEEQSGLKPSTIHGYKQVWREHLQSHFGTICLHEYTTGKLSQLLTSMAKTKRPGTIASVKWLASAIFAHAVATDHCETNPCRDAKVLGKTLGHGDTKSYTLEEAENVISALVDNVMAQLIMALSCFLGIRKGEIQGLQWGDVDADFIHIRRAASRGIIGDPKSKKSVRSLPLIQPVRGLLMLWRAKCPSDQKWMFQNGDGNPFDMAFIATKIIRPALKKAGVQWKGYHAGRRGLGTALRAITGDSTAGRDVLGHATTQATEAHYEHRLPEVALGALKQLEAKISR